MDLKKSHWEAGEERLSLSVPIQKVDKENRLVRGFATLDNIDAADDVITAEASIAAFNAFLGNIREMHQPIAVGKLVDFEEEEFFHNGEFYRGIYVTVYVSKGAEDTWEKVLDGTLSGFSVGGNITQQETLFVKDAGENGKAIRFIKGFDLVELSLVDSPCNRLANVFSIVKNSEGSFIKGMVAETSVVNIFWCGTDEIAKNSTEKSEVCLTCGTNMEQIGWFEQGEDNAVKTAAAVADFLRVKEDSTVEKASETANDEGGVNVADEVVNNENENANEEGVVTSEEVTNDEGVKTDAEEAKTEEGGDTAVESDDTAKAETVAEVAPEADFEKMLEDLAGSVRDTIEKTVEKVESRLEENNEAQTKKYAEFEKSLDDLNKRLEGIKNDREDVAKRLDALEKSSAIKKSGEVESEPVEKSNKSDKSIWGGTFFKDD